MWRAVGTRCASLAEVLLHLLLLALSIVEKKVGSGVRLRVCQGQLPLQRQPSQSVVPVTLVT